MRCAQFVMRVTRLGSFAAKFVRPYEATVKRTLHAHGRRTEPDARTLGDFLNQLDAEQVSKRGEAHGLTFYSHSHPIPFCHVFSGNDYLQSVRTRRQDEVLVYTWDLSVEREGE